MWPGDEASNYTCGRVTNHICHQWISAKWPQKRFPSVQLNFSWGARPQTSLAAACVPPVTSTTPSSNSLLRLCKVQGTCQWPHICCMFFLDCLASSYLLPRHQLISTDYQTLFWPEEQWCSQTLHLESRHKRPWIPPQYWRQNCGSSSTHIQNHKTINCNWK